MMNFKLLSTLAFFISLVAAQTGTTTGTSEVTGSDSMTEGTSTVSAMPTGGPGPAVPIPDCVQTCLDQSGCNAQDINCLCTTGLQSVTTCVVSNCSPEDQAAAAGLQSLCPSGGMTSGAMNSTMSTMSTPTGNATTSSGDGTNSTDSIPMMTSTRSTSSASLTPRPLSSSSSSNSMSPSGSGSATANAPASTDNNNNGGISQNGLGKGVWVMVAGVFAVAVAA